MATAEEQGFLGAIKENGADVATRLAYADWLEEHDRPYEAMLQRVKAGVSEARFKIRRKSDGLFSDGRFGWEADKGKEWRNLAAVRAHFTSDSTSPRYHGADWDDLEVVVFEVRMQPVTALTVTQDPTRQFGSVTVHEPKVGKTP